MISEITIRKVRELAIEDVLSPYVRLSKKGSTLMGLCPFHSEKTGSFAVTPSKNLFHCFSCNRGGDSITFIMEKENLSFSAAVEFIARNHNIPVEYIREECSEEQMAEARHPGVTSDSSRYSTVFLPAKFKSNRQGREP